MTSTAPLALSISSQLIQDYLYINEPPPPALAETGSLVAIEGGLLAIDGSSVTHFELEPTSQGGWKTSTITVPVPPTAADATIMTIKAFIINGNKNGDVPSSTLNLLCFFPAAGWADGGGAQAAYAVSWLVREAGGTWQEAMLSAAAIGLLSQVQSVDVFDAGNGEGKFVYGLTTGILGRNNVQMFVLKIWNYNLITTAPWQIASQQPVPDLPAARATFLASGSADSPRSVSLCLCTSSGSATTVSWSPPLEVDEENGPDISDMSGFGSATVPGGIIEFQPVNGLSQWAAVAVNDAGMVFRLGFPSDVSQDCVVTGINDAVGPTNVSAVSLSRRAQQSTSLFAVGDGRLWLTRDIGNVGWVELGDPVVQLATPGHDPTVFEVFYADPTAAGGNRIYHLSQDTTNSVWKRQTLATWKAATFIPGGPGPTEVGTVAIELSATDHGTGQAASKAAIIVGADQWVVLLVDKLSYWVGPGTSQRIPADKLGSIAIRYHATDLKFPHLTFHATEHGRPNSPTVGCRGDMIDGDQSPSTSTVANRLAGNGDDAEFSMTTAALQRRNLLPGKADDHKTTHCIRTLGRYMVSSYASQSQPAMTSEPPTSWTFRSTGSGYRCDVSVGDRALDLGGFADDAGDVMNWLKHTTQDVGDFVVSVADDIATVTVGIYNFTVRTARQAADAIGTILAKVMAGIRELEDVLKDLIDFLKMLFAWKDIVDTHKALKTLLSWGINYIPANSQAVASWVDGRLSALGDDISGALSKAEAHLRTSDVTPNGYAQANKLSTPGQSTPDLAGSVYQVHLTNHKSRCNYLLSRSRPHVGAITHKPGNSATIDTAMNAGFAGPNITGQQATLLPAIQALLCPDGVADVTRVLETSALSLLEIFKDLINDAVLGLEDVVKAVLGAIASAAEWCSGILSDPLDIPVVSWLYSSLIEGTLTPSNNDLSILDLFCLILAVPVTVVYKLLRNGEAPFGGSRVAAMTAAFGDPAHTDFAALSNFASDGMVAAAAADGLAIAAEVLGCVAGCLDLFAGVVGTYADMIAMTNQFLDMETTPSQALVSWVSWALSTLTTLCEAPIGVLAGFAQGGGNLPVEIATVTYFGLEILPNIGDFICLAASKTSVMRMLPNSGAYWDGACGLVILGGAIAYIIIDAIEGEGGPWDYINALISNINRPVRLMMPWLTSFDVPALAVIVPVVVATDVVATIGGTVTQIGSASRG